MPARAVAAGIAAVLLLGGVVAWQATRRGAGQREPEIVYTSAGYGGYVAAGQQKHPQPAADPLLQPALAAYEAGRYREAEERARGLLTPRPGQTAARADQRLRARWVLAFSAARRHDLKAARERFGALRDEAVKLPDPARQVRLDPAPRPGENTPTLAEEGAYQHAVLAAALGNPKAAEAELSAFMRCYPESPLVQAAVKRIARFHGGDLPREAERTWRHAMLTARTRQKERERQQSLCGPECLAELLRRRGEPAEVEALAREMRTSERGTSLAALVEAAKRRGMKARGLSLTRRALTRQRRPLIALVAPGHLVLLEQIQPFHVTVWDPDAKGPGKSARRRVEADAWFKDWSGTALVFE